MSGKLKIALCLSGEPRSSMFCFSYYYETFLQNNHMFETDVYIHAWKNFRALPLYNPIKYKIDVIDEDKYLQDVFNNSGLENLLVVRKDLEFFGTLTRKRVKLYNTLLMWSSIKKCFNLIDNPDDYDIIIRGRFDSFFSNKLDLNSPLLDIAFYKHFDIIVPFRQYPLDKPHITDQFAIGTPQAMKIYSSLIDNITPIVDQTESVIPEIILSQYLRNQKLKIKDSLPHPELVRGVNAIVHIPTPTSFIDQ